MFLSLISAVVNGLSVSELVLYICVYAFVVICCFPVHESAHAFVAYKLGDPTGKNMGRISMNPRNHLTLVGTLMMVFLGFGYAKPVPVNCRYFKNKKGGMALTALAGPVSNLLLALLFSMLSTVSVLLLYKTDSGSSLFMPFILDYFKTGELSPTEFIECSIYYSDSSVLVSASKFFYLLAYSNITLAIFNFIPFPPLDGAKILGIVLPERVYFKFLSIERYLIYVLFGLIFIFDRLDFSPVGFLGEHVLEGVTFITTLPVKFLL